MANSKYEEKFIELLLKSNSFFKKEYSPKDLKSIKGGRLRYDFVVYKDKNYKNIKYIIEVDGEQHFKRIPKFHRTEAQFKYALEMDVRKNSYCLTKGIKLYRIPYYDIDEINNLKDIFKPKYLVESRWHNHQIIQKRK